MKIIPDAPKNRLSAVAAFLIRRKQNAGYRSIAAICVLAALTVVSCFYLAARPQRYAVFAGYSADGDVAPYTIRYLKGLKAVSKGVVYITDSPLSDEAQKKVAPYIMHGEFARHGEYDWGSYKRGFNWLKESGLLRQADEVIFANDSTYAPLKSFKPMFRAMGRRGELDFWGNTQNTKFNPHLQSYFLVFRRPVLRSKSFETFLNGVKAQPHHSLYITEYEIKLTPYLENLGYKWGSYIPKLTPPAIGDGEVSTDPNSYPVTLIGKYKNQFLKRRTFTDKLPIAEDRGKLLKLLKKYAPEVYDFVAAEFPAALSGGQTEEAQP